MPSIRGLSRSGGDCQGACVEVGRRARFKLTVQRKRRAGRDGYISSQPARAPWGEKGLAQRGEGAMTTLAVVLSRAASTVNRSRVPGGESKLIMTSERLRLSARRGCRARTTIIGLLPDL